MKWNYIEKENYIRQCDKLKVHKDVKVAIQSWAVEMSVQNNTPSQSRIYISESSRFQAWSVRIPNKSKQKGSRGGYRIFLYVDRLEKTINIDNIEERKDLGAKKSGSRRKQRQNYYVQGLKDLLDLLDQDNRVE